MATKTVYLSGTCKWAKLARPDDKYKNYTMDLYPDETGLKNLEASGYKAKFKEDADGEKFIT